MSRYARFLLKRLARQREREEIKNFVKHGLLRPVIGRVGTDVVRSYLPSEHFPALGSDDAFALNFLRKLTKEAFDGVSYSAALSHSGISSGKSERKRARRKDADRGNQTIPDLDADSDASAPAFTGRGEKSFDRELRLIRRLARPPRTNEVVALLLVARMLDRLGSEDKAMLASLLRGNRPSGILTFRSEVGDSEDILALLITNGILAPRMVKFVTSTGADWNFSRRDTEDIGDPVIDVVRFDSDLCRSGDVATRIYLDQAMQTGLSVLFLSDTSESIPQRLEAAADLALTILPMDWPLLSDAMALILGVAVDPVELKSTCPGLDPASLGLNDIALALRPGRSVREVTKTLLTIAKALENTASDTEDQDEEGHGGCRAAGTEKRGRGGGRSNRTMVGKTRGSDFVKPVPDFVTINARTGQPIPRVEFLSGYGAARDWALELKADLDLWQSGEARWSDLSTKLLLSGPPGTGKTIFAKALCNTLQIPLLATSMAHWLEGGHLGEVLRRMGAAFEEAKEQSPCILFVDEIDNLGKRGGSARDYDDYWQSLVNRMLELLDGAVKREGVIIVAATNLPERIDPALLRSGRLERHIIIPQPDAAALAGILAHHLGADLARIIETAPEGLLGIAIAAEGAAKPKGDERPFDVWADDVGTDACASANASLGSR